MNNKVILETVMKQSLMFCVAALGALSLNAASLMPVKDKITIGGSDGSSFKEEKGILTLNRDTPGIQVFLRGAINFKEKISSDFEADDALVVEHNGDVYSCDHFVYPEYLLGNIRETPLAEIYRSKKRRDFGLAKRNALPAECLRCKYYFACRGECPKHRFETGSDGCRKNSLCEGLFRYFRHVEPYMEYMREMLSKEQSPAWVIPFARKRMGLM